MGYRGQMNHSSDVADPKSPKSIGTYSRKRDAAYFIDHRGNKISYRRLLDKISKKRLDEKKFDALCIGTYR
ncbi:hypothetical protein Y032_0154g2976 [Ancylostoma ceylanicum]|uniref:Uncharacterized protein n=1 Tax=Ancylostoma ceylanicum TaxID=53326 RepID=A0A016T082_9BILA|nr:hypothetical protein Y032_0154g2976 [Ancylostoma ceylanicum]